MSSWIAITTAAGEAQTSFSDEHQRRGTLLLRRQLPPAGDCRGILETALRRKEEWK